MKRAFVFRLYSAQFYNILTFGPAYITRGDGLLGFECYDGCYDKCYDVSVNKSGNNFVRCDPARSDLFPSVKVRYRGCHFSLNQNVTSINDLRKYSI